jgi:hypothetical protein
LATLVWLLLECGAHQDRWQPFELSTGAYAQIIPPIIEAAGYDKSAVALPWTALVYAGTYAEFVLPVLLVIGLFGRLAALGMIGFVIVQSYVDLTFHGVDAETAGAWFDRFPDGDHLRSAPALALSADLPGAQGPWPVVGRWPARAAVRPSLDPAWFRLAAVLEPSRPF